MPIMFFNILTAISLDAIPEMMKNASDNITLNKIEYFEAIEFYNLQEHKANVKCFEKINKYGKILSLTLYKVYEFVTGIVKKYFVNLFWYNFLKKKDNTKKKDEKDVNDLIEEKFESIVKSNEKNTEKLISTIKLLTSKVELKEREAKEELEENLNKTNGEKNKEIERNSNEALKTTINEMNEKINKMNEKINKMDDKIEKIIQTLNPSSISSVTYLNNLLPQESDENDNGKNRYTYMFSEDIPTSLDDFKKKEKNG